MIGLYIYFAIGIAIVAAIVCFVLIKDEDFKTYCRSPLFWIRCIITAMIYPLYFLAGVIVGIKQSKEDK